MGFDQPAARHVPAPPSTIRSSPSICALTPLATRPAAVAARRSDSLTRNSCKPFIRVTPLAKAATTARIEIFVDHRRRARGGNIDARPVRRDARAGPRPPRRLPRGGRECRSARPFRASVVRKPVRSGIHHHAFDDDVGAFHQRGRRDEEGGGRGIDRHDDRARRQFRPAFEHDLAAMLAKGLRTQFGAEIGQHLLGMVAARLALDDRGAAERVEPRQQDRRLDLRRGDRGAIFDRGRFGRSLEQDRAAPALGLFEHLRAHQDERIENAAHRALAQRGVAVEARGDAVAADHAHHQARAGAGIAEIQRAGRLEDRAEAHAANGPAAFAEPLDRRAELRRRRGRCCSTSSPSSRPATLVSPTESRPSRKARWEMLLSPGGRAFPRSGPQACGGERFGGCGMGHGWGRFRTGRRISAGLCRSAAGWSGSGLLR